MTVEPLQTQHQLSHRLRPLRPLRPTPRRTRSGSLLVEMVICMVLLSSVMLVLAPSLLAVQRQRQAVRFETLTLIELQNLAAQLQTGQPAEQLTLATWFVRRYADAELQIEPVPQSDSQTEFSVMRISIQRPAADDQLPATRRSLVVWLAEESE